MSELLPRELVQPAEICHQVGCHNEVEFELAEHKVCAQHHPNQDNVVVSKILNATSRNDRLLSAFMKQVLLDVQDKISFREILLAALDKATAAVEQNLDD